MLRSVAVLYWITSKYGVSTLSLDDGGTFRQPISTQHLEAKKGMFTFFCAVVCIQCLVCLLLILIAVAPDSCGARRCPGCVRLSLALRAYVEFCALRTLR